MPVDHEDYLPGEAPAAHKETHQDGGTDEISIADLAGVSTELAAHALLPTVHQDAPDLILTHKGIASAHHAKYTDVEARASFSPLAINYSAFMPVYDTHHWQLTNLALTNRDILTGQWYYAPVVFPHGITVSKLTLYGSRNDALAVMILNLCRSTYLGAQLVMSELVANWTTGWSLRYDDSIDQPIIDNYTYSYCLNLLLHPNDSQWDVQFSGAKIEFTG